MNAPFDFGFTAIDEDELDKVQEIQSQVDEKVDIEVKKTEALYDAILPLLENLKKDPEKEYIYWPDRVKKVNAFKEYLDSILYNTTENGEQK